MYFPHSGGSESFGVMMVLAGIAFAAIWLFNARQMGKFRKWGIEPIAMTPRNARIVVAVIFCGIILLALLGVVLRRCEVL